MLILLCGGIATTWLAYDMARQIEKEARTTLELHALDFQDEVGTKLRRYEDILFGIAGLYQTTAEVTPAQFQAYASQLDKGNRFSALSVINYAEYVQRPERDGFIQRVAHELDPGRTHGIAAMLAPQDSEYMVITRAYPQGSATLGFNLLSNAQRLSKELSPQISAKFYRPGIVASTGIPLRRAGEPTLLLAARLGVFKPGADGQPRLVGTAGIGFNIERFFREAAASSAKRAYYQVETIGNPNGTIRAKPVLLYTSDAFTASDAVERYTTSFPLSFGGALLRIQLSENKWDLIDKRNRFLPMVVFLTGLLLSLMAAALYRRVSGRNLELQQAIRLQTVDLRRENHRAKQLEREIAHIAEEERRRIGQELHDDLGQRLTGMSLSSKALSAALQPVSPELSAHAAALEREASTAIANVRGLAHGLMPVPPGPQGLRDALEQLAISVSSLHTVQCIFDFDDPVDIDNPDVATNLYRIAQEAVNNAIRHAQATVVNIRLDYDDDKITLLVSDNGVGFEYGGFANTQSPHEVGAGLRIMTYRASVINFALTVESAVGRGTIIKAQEC